MPKIIYHDSDGIDKSVMLGAEPILIGRATECQIQTQDAMVSRRHARISWDGNYVIEDLGSSNGVYVGHDKVQRAAIRPGDTVTCGSLVLKLVPDTSRASGVSLPDAPGLGPPMAPPPMAPPPMAPPPMAPPPMASPAAGLAPPPLGSVPSADAFLAAREANTAPTPLGPRSSAPPAITGPATPQLAADLGEERRRRVAAEEALEKTKAQLKSTENRAAEAEAAARDASALKRKVDQLTADLRRLRGGREPEPGTEQEALRALEEERDRLEKRVAALEGELSRAGAAAAMSSFDSGESAKLKRQVEQLTTELRRVRGGAPPAPAPAPAPAGPDPAALEAAQAISDALAELRTSLHAAGDEAALLKTPAESVAVVAEALKTAGEQLEAARERARHLGKLLGG